jgi:hypothetical protein
MPNHEMPQAMIVTTSSFPVFITRSFPKGFQVACACGFIGNKGEEGTDFTAHANGLVAIYRKHESWHRQNWLAEKAARDELAQVAATVEDSPEPGGGNLPGVDHDSHPAQPKPKGTRKSPAKKLEVVH